MDRLIRIFVVDVKGIRKTFVFDISRFVSYNVDTRVLTLVNGSVRVHADSENHLIESYRSYFGEGGAYVSED